MASTPRHCLNSLTTIFPLPSISLLFVLNGLFCYIFLSIQTLSSTSAHAFVNVHYFDNLFDFTELQQYLEQKINGLLLRFLLLFVIIIVILTLCWLVRCRLGDVLLHKEWEKQLLSKHTQGYIFEQNDFSFYIFRDTAGQERYETITTQYYRRAHVSSAKIWFINISMSSYLVKNKYTFNDLMGSIF